MIWSSPSGEIVARSKGLGGGDWKLCLREQRGNLLFSAVQAGAFNSVPYWVPPLHAASDVQSFQAVLNGREDSWSGAQPQVLQPMTERQA